MNRMIATLKIKMIDAVRKDRGEAIVSARNICFHCADKRACGSWLKANKNPSAPPHFCPNSTFLEQLRVTAHERKNTHGWQ